MEFPKINRFDIETVRSKIMGPNTLKLTEELLEGEPLPPGSVVLDLGSGSGISSGLLAREYGFVTYAAVQAGALDYLITIKVVLRRS